MRFSLTIKLNFYLLLRIFLGNSTTTCPVLKMAQPLLNLANVELYIICIFFFLAIFLLSAEYFYVPTSWFCPGVQKHKGITIVRSLFVLCVRSYCLAAVYCWSFVSTLVHRYTRTEPTSFPVQDLEKCIENSLSGCKLQQKLKSLCRVPLAQLLYM